MTSQSRHSRPAARPGLTPPESGGTYKREARPAPPVPPRARRRNNLPHVPSSFVGREHDVAEVAGLLTKSRLVTLTGAGGMGKTRLAVEVALRLAPKFPDGAWLVELASLTDPALLPESIASVLPGSQCHVGLRSTDQLASDIGDQSMLLILDNCEHLVESCGRTVDLLLRSSPQLRVLATSREPLGIGGEHRWSVGPLSLPQTAQADAGSVKRSEAGRLFLERAVATFPDFDLTDSMAPTVSQICARLDGMPLAIELAAARLASLSAADVLERLDDRFGFLTTGSRSVMARHQTLAAALAWSYEMLSPAETKLLQRVSVFAGWSLEAAQEVCAWGEVSSDEIVDDLTALVSKSLVMVEQQSGRVRYSLLETVRAWVQPRIEAPDLAELRERHAMWCLNLAEQADRELGRSARHQWLDRLDSEHDNLRAALEWARTTDAAEVGSRLAAALIGYWDMRGHLGEGLGWLEWAVSVSDECAAPLRARVLRAAGLAHGTLGDLSAALPLLEQSSILFAEAGDHDASLCACNSTFHMLRNPRQAVPRLKKDIEQCQQSGDAEKLAHFLWALGQAHFLLGDIADARRSFEECVDLGRREAGGDAVCSGLLGLGRIEVLIGDSEAAEAAFSEARSIAEDMADTDGVATALALLGDLARARGDYDRARTLLGESMALTSGGVPVALARVVYFQARLAQAEVNGAGSDGGARDLFAKALSLAGEADGLGFHEARCRLGLGWSAQSTGDRSGAARQYLEALAMAQAINDSQATAQALDHLSSLARLDGNLEEADKLARRGLELHHRTGDVAGIAASLNSIAGLAVDGERWQLAARLLAAARAVLERAGYMPSGPEQTRHDGEVVRVRAAMTPKDFAAAWDEGASLSADDACAYAARGRAGRDRPATGWESLTPAERQVVTLVGGGLTNPEVGQRLFISPRTVGHHLSHVYQKLGIHSRGALIKELASREGHLA